MNRRIFLKSVGSVASIAAGISVGAANLGGTSVATPAAPVQEPFSGVDCWLPRGGTAINELFQAMLDEVELVRVTFADVPAASFKKWSEAPGHSGRWFRPDLVIANFRPTRSEFHSRLLRLAASHHEARDFVVAIVRHTDFLVPSAVRSSVLFRYLSRLGIPVFAAGNRPEPTELLMDLTAPEVGSFFDWADLRHVFRSGSFAAYSRGFASGPSCVCEAVLECASSFEQQGIVLDHAAGMVLTVYADDLKTFYSTVDHCRNQFPGPARVLFKWNRAWSCQRVDVTVAVVGQLDEMVAA